MKTKIVDDGLFHENCNPGDSWHKHALRVICGDSSFTNNPAPSPEFWTVREGSCSQLVSLAKVRG